MIIVMKVLVMTINNKLFRNFIFSHDDESIMVGDKKTNKEKFSQITKHLSPCYNKDIVTVNKQHL